ncbi:MAG TPA: DMT family transporter [Vitreimonas sp.]|uniref:DMT family transporter n=1 Tax=Vitreimonas sp. TaxID=3069702 RepID=UPI002D3D3683|nr:DMT family transporter [Vitreimonas sp.]HYD88494.1 DMT family transporter [Vitreimonas sp.]
MTAPPRAFAPLDLLQLISIALIWGANNIFAKIAVEAFPPMMTVALRFVIVLAALFMWIRPPPRQTWRMFGLMLLFVGPLHFGIQYAGLKLATDITPMVVAMQLWAPASVVFAALLLGERVGTLRWGGVAIAFLGAASMNFDPAVFAQGWALFLVALAPLCYGFGTVLVRRMGGGVDPWAMQAWLALATAPTMSLASLAFESGQIEAAVNAPWYAWACIAFGAIVSSIVANAFMFRLVQKYEVSRTTPFLLMTPVFSFALAVLILGSRITPQILLGAAMTIGGVALVALAERRFKAVA